jgi:hypothetical protein
LGYGFIAGRKKFPTFTARWTLFYSVAVNPALPI